MRLQQTTHLTVPVDGTVADVLAIIENADEVQDFVAPLLDDSTSGTRWVVEPVRLGPVTIRPMCEVSVTRAGDTVAVRGRPVPGATPTWLDVEMTGVPRGDACTIEVDWQIRVDLPGPQFVARLAKPLLDAETRVVTADLTTRLRQRFATPDMAASSDAMPKPMTEPMTEPMPDPVTDTNADLDTPTDPA